MERLSDNIYLEKPSEWYDDYRERWRAERLNDTGWEVYRALVDFCEEFDLDVVDTLDDILIEDEFSLADELRGEFDDDCGD